jgi:hypothetical protein
MLLRPLTEPAQLHSPHLSSNQGTKIYAAQKQFKIVFKSSLEVLHQLHTSVTPALKFYVFSAEEILPLKLLVTLRTSALHSHLQAYC